MRHGPPKHNIQRVNIDLNNLSSRHSRSTAVIQLADSIAPIHSFSDVNPYTTAPQLPLTLTHSSYHWIRTQMFRDPELRDNLAIYPSGKRVRGGSFLVPVDQSHIPAPQHLLSRLGGNAFNIDLC